MRRFRIHVVLHGATWHDYEDLHVRLAAFGIANVVTAADGVRYRLPPREYVYVGGVDAQDVLNWIRQCAAQVGRSCIAVVSESVACVWHGLTAA